MSKIDYVQLPEPLFLGRKNHGVKVPNGNGVSIEHDELDRVIIRYNGQKATIKHYSALIENDTPETAKAAPAPAPRGKIKAQASTPHDHVFAEGSGKTRD